MEAVKVDAKTIRVLMQNRRSAFTHRGGDTVVMECLKAELERLGVSISIDLEGKEDASNYDIVHLFNFALPEILRVQAEKASSAGVPFVITSLCEDIASFHNQSHGLAALLISYLKAGQDSAWFEQNKSFVESISPSQSFDNQRVALAAACVFTSGSRESDVIKKLYGKSVKTKEIHFGHNVISEADPSLFVSQYGIKDFVLCVGRIESRKNQLMLLKALEDVELPVVLVAGNFSYQPEYDEAVRNFKRKGETIILGTLSDEMLASAYAACKIHALPSWYELPGLVSIEAAHYGKNVVVSDTGSTRDYLQNLAFYCDPSNEESIRNAVLGAYYTSSKEGLSDHTKSFTWEYAAKQTLQCYLDICSQKCIDVSENDEINALLEAGEFAAKENDLTKAWELLLKAQSTGGSSGRLYRALGAVCLAQSNVDLSIEYFNKALSLDSNDAKALSGRGMCSMMKGEKEEAYSSFVKSLEIVPNQLVPILQLIECSYILGRYDDLETVLRRFLQDCPDDLQMQFCLAGCLYKLGKYGEAMLWNEKVLQSDATHRGGNELKRLLDEVKESDIGGSNVGQDMTTRISNIEEEKRKRNYIEALKMADALLEDTSLIDEVRQGVSLLRAELLTLLGRLREADEVFEWAIRHGNRTPRALCGKGAVCAARGDWQGAHGFFTEAWKKDQKSDVAKAGLGLWHQTRNELDAAWECYKDAVSLNPENVRGLLGMIELGYPLKKLKDVERVIIQYLEMHPADLDFVYALAGCYYAQHRVDEAVGEIEKIRLFQPDHAQANELLEMIAGEKGEKQLTV